MEDKPYTCHTCKKGTDVLIACHSNTEKLTCPQCDPCNTGERTFVNRAPEVVECWKDAKGKTRKVTKGKAWEIKNRGKADDGRTIINTKTGKEAQF